ncbi:MAG: HlyC/CorC family transporter [Planctomycetes bacterium]|nr:HlyC/CorC family transporter [Planctomycetota bacterium]MCP4771362.1 HlyC/CorC family transporter [Planctomycetota bacterium]MCP4861799.1 HlyC/CorC family transporter [Planctomycetota bacterium]
MGLILAVATFTLAASFICSLFEAALYAVTPSQVELLKQRGGRGARRLEALRNDIEEPIASILTVNTIAHTVGASWCGAMVAQQYGEQSVVWFATIFTIAVLGLTEIIPKSLGVRHAATLAPRIAIPLQLMTWISWPIARPARAAMRRFSGTHKNVGPSEDEVLVFARLACRHGQMRGEESVWIENALTLDRVRVHELMTPRRVVEKLSADMTVADAIARTDRWIHSRVPVFDPQDPEEILGVVYRREVFDAGIDNKGEIKIGDLSRTLESVPESMKAHTLLQMFLQRRRHLVAVIDEYGSFQGIVTLEDVLESMLGAEIVDEHDEVADLQEHARASNPHSDLETPEQGK